MKLGDKLVIAALLAAAAVLFVLSLTLGGQQGEWAVVTVDGEVAARLPLAQDTQQRFPGGAEGGGNLVCVENGEVYMKAADCPDGHCISQGRISQTGEIIVCLPNRTTITIEGAQDSQLDAVVY